MEGSHAPARVSALGGYLRARRGLVSPEQVGIARGGRRRVTGLRREEVALLAGISADYYLRLERGRDDNPSPQVLLALARVLQLDEVETGYLLAFTAPGRAADRRSPPAGRTADRVPARLDHLLAAVGVPAFVEDRRFDVLASNPSAVALSPRLAPGHNRLRSLLLDPAERRFHRDWDSAVTGLVAAFRHSTRDQLTPGAAGRAADPHTVELVAEFARVSPRFREVWARHDVARLEGGAVEVVHPLVGPLHLLREKLPVGDLVLVVYYPEPGSDSADRLTRLASGAGPTAGGTAAPGPRAGGDRRPGSVEGDGARTGDDDRS